MTKDTIMSVIIIIILLIGMFLVSIWGYNVFVETGDLMEYCKENGYDGIRYEKVNFLREEPKCVHFTIEEEFKKSRGRR